MGSLFTEDPKEFYRIQLRPLWSLLSIDYTPRQIKERVLQGLREKNPNNVCAIQMIEVVLDEFINKAEKKNG